MGRKERNAGMLKAEEEVRDWGIGKERLVVRDKIEYRIRGSLGLYMVG
jgi:hypothetical protein